MKLYDETICKIKNLLKCDEVSFEQPFNQHWPMVTDHSMILKKDMAFELGSQPYYGIGLTLITEDSALVPQDRIFVHGKDISVLDTNSHYARVAVVRVASKSMGEGDSLYRSIRALEYARYHFYPEGFMMRVSALQNKESVRISKKAVEKGISFSLIGTEMIRLLKKQDNVEAVELYYITDSSFDYQALEKLGKQGEDITRTIDHILNDVKMDCQVCHLKPVCDEFDGLKELHFSKQKEMDWI